MNKVELKEFGLNLSGRPLGKRIYSTILKSYAVPCQLDFAGVVSVGSGFADEVVAKLAALNGGSITVLNANSIVRKCLEDVSAENNFEITMI